MARVEINAQVPQLPLVMKESGVGVPMNLDGLKDGPEVHRVLVGQRLWNERPKRSSNKILVVDTKTGISGLLEHESLCFSKVTSTGEDLTKKRLSTIIILTDEIPSDGSILGLDSLTSIKKRLTKAGVLFVFEKKSKDTKFDKDLRLERLRLADFKKIDVLTGLSKEFNIWRGRGEKTSKRKGVNFLDFSGDKFWRKNMIMDICDEVEKEYESVGCRILTAKEVKRLKCGYDRNPIFERLGDSNNIPSDLSALKNGFGLIIEGETCGCIMEIRLDGTQYKIEECRGDICQFY